LRNGGRRLTSDGYRRRSAGRREVAYLVEAAGVVVAVVDSDLAAVDAGVASDAEVVWHERRAVLLQDHMALQERALRDACVDLLVLSDHDRLVLEVVEDGDLADAEILEAALDDVLLEVALETQDL